MEFVICLMLLFGSLQQPLEGKVSSGHFSDCGNANKRLTISSGSVHPDPIQYPGNLFLAINVEVIKDLPSTDFKMHINLEKVTPFRFQVPCFYPIGSCSYDVCSAIMNYQEILCPAFPNPNECGCPMKAAIYKINVGYPIPDYGKIITNLIKGNYQGNMTFYDQSSNTEVGCIAFAFEIVPGE